MPQKYKTGKNMIISDHVSLAERSFLFQDDDLDGASLEGTSSVSANAKDVAEYAEKLLIELRGLASGAGLTFLAYLIQVAVEEARIQAEEHKDDA
jgi:hypothetical protein